MSHSNSPRLLYLVDYDNEILRRPTEKVNFPLSQEDQDIIRDMRFSIQAEQLKKADAPWDAAVGMAANQWGINKSIFLYCPDGDSVNGLEVVINPSYEPIETSDSSEQERNEPTKKTMETLKTMNETWEGCFSVPLASGYIRRYQSIRVTYQNEAGETIHREISGFPARVWQHENDHLNGHLYDDPNTGKCLEKRTFSNLEAVDNFYEKVREERKRKYAAELKALQETRKK